jgi:hypothetical protein
MVPLAMVWVGAGLSVSWIVALAAACRSKPPRPRVRPQAHAPSLHGTRAEHGAAGLERPLLLGAADSTERLRPKLQPLPWWWLVFIALFMFPMQLTWQLLTTILFPADIRRGRCWQVFCTIVCCHSYGFPMQNRAE